MTRGSSKRGYAPVTFAVGPKRVARAIVVALAQLGKNGGTRAEIAAISKVPDRTCKRHLRMLVNGGVVKEPYRGRYVLAHGTPEIQTDPNGKMGLHDILLVAEDWPCEAPPGPESWPDGLTTTRPPTLTLRPLGAFGPLQPVERTVFWEATHFWGHRAVGFRFNPNTRTMQVSLPADRAPLEFEEVEQFWGWLEAMVSGERNRDLLFLRKVGVHVDYWRWELDGLHKVRLTAWVNAYRQVYQKFRDLIRDEIHLTLKELKLKEAVELLGEMSPTAQVARATLVEASVLERHRETVAALQQQVADLKLELIRVQAENGKAIIEALKPKEQAVPKAPGPEPPGSQEMFR